MRMVDIIQAKRDKQKLSKEQIDFFVNGYTDNSIPDYQMSALLMAIYLNGMDDEEISMLTDSMANSGEMVDLSQIKGIKVDKHSTGGVGDKASLIVLPLVASAGVPVAKMSGRGLGHTGGTVDKLEAIKGFKIELDSSSFISNVNNYGVALVGQSGNLAPADKKIYALRDVTSTVSSIPLIASSVMSKKIASGADAIVLDVKIGSGAFMKTIEDAKELATIMVSIGKKLNRNTIAVLSNMDEPLGYEVGNANEVKESIEILSGRGEEKLRELCIDLAAYMCVAGQVYSNVEEAKKGIAEIIDSGKGLAKFKEFIVAQGGDGNIVDNPDLLPNSKLHIDVPSLESGYVHSINAEKIGVGAMVIGAGRKTKEDQIDHSVGVTLKKKIGYSVSKGEPLATVHCQTEEQFKECQKYIYDAYQIRNEKPSEAPIIIEVIS